MEVPAISNGGGSYAPSPAYSAAALQASSAAAIDLPAGDYGPMSITVASQVNMVFGQMTQGGAVDPETLKALIMLLVLQLLMNGGQGDQGQQALGGLAQAFQQSGNGEMSMVAMQASSMVQIDFAGGQMPAMSIEAGAGASLDVLA